MNLDQKNCWILGGGCCSLFYLVLFVFSVYLLNCLSSTKYRAEFDIWQGCVKGVPSSTARLDKFKRSSFAIRLSPLPSVSPLIWYCPFWCFSNLTDDHFEHSKKGKDSNRNPKIWFVYHSCLFQPLIECLRGYSQKSWVEAFGLLPKTLNLLMTKIGDFRFPLHDLTKHLLPAVALNTI